MTQDTATRALTPQALANMSRLELRARSVMEGVISGLHRSPHRGYSVEFAQHREYSRGDEIRHIDWQVFGRTDRLYVKQFEEETNLQALLAVDISGSMTYGSGPLTKLQYASVLAGALTFLLLKQRDAVGLALLHTDVARFVPPSSAPSQLRILFDLLEAAQPSPERGLAPTLHELAERVRRRGMVILLSDLLEDPAELLSGIRHLKHRRHDVLVLHVLDRAELQFPFDSTTRFVGLEGQGEIAADPRSLRNSYLDLMQAHLSALETGCREIGVDYVLMPSDQAPDAALTRYLSARASVV